MGVIPALIPFWQPRVLHLGPIPIDPWATLVLIGCVLGLEVGRGRGLKKGIEPKDVVDGAVFVVGMGFLFGHWVHVIAYHPELMHKDGVFHLGTAIVELAKVWAGFSSNGGFLGAIIGAVIFYKFIRKRPFWKMADNAMYAFPFGFMFGRLGCFTVHDHIGVQVADFPLLGFLAVDFPEPYQPRYDLGLLEAIGILGIAITFFVVERVWKNGPDGKYLALWAFLYAPMRFGLEFLRHSDLETADALYFGLTPAQYGSMLMMFGGACVLGFLVWRSKQQPAPEPVIDAPA